MSNIYHKNLSGTDLHDPKDHTHNGGTEYMVPIWAEEAAGLAATTYEWSFGNGAETPSDGGLTVYVPTDWTCTVVAMSLRLAAGTATVELVLNGTPQGVNCNVAIASGQGNTEDGFTPLSISSGDYINFRTTAASSTNTPNVVTAWLRYVKS